MKRTFFTLANIIGWAALAATIIYFVVAAWEHHPSKLSADIFELLLLFAVLTWIFVGATDQSFTYRKNKAYYSPIHYAMLGGLATLFINGWKITDNTNLTLILLVIIVVNANAMSLRRGISVWNWRYTGDKPLTQEQVLNILNEKAMLIDITKTDSVTLIRGRSSLIVDIRVELSEQRTKINIGYQQSWLVLLFAMKIMPTGVSETYVKKFMSALNSKGA